MLVRGDLAQDPAHDLAAARLRQIGRPLDQIRRGDRADLLPHLHHQLLAQRLARLVAGLQGDIGIDALALDVVRIAHDRGLGHLGMRDQRAAFSSRTGATAASQTRPRRPPSRA